MLVGTLNKIREERAALIRDVEYIREMALEDAVDDRLFDLEMRTVKESGNIYAESAKTIEQIPVDDSFRNEEIARILNSDRNLTFDEMLGIEE
jgi:hypothetical protein